MSKSRLNERLQASKSAHLHRAKKLTSAIRMGIWGGASGLCTAFIVAGATPVHAQTSNDAENVGIEEVVVTGSRIRRNGYSAPTPTTVASTDELLKYDPSTLADGLNQLPQFQNSSRPQNGGVSANGAAGSNLLNLRNMGSQRNLVLLNGRRFVAATDAGSTDINLLPQNLVQRVEVVTGGASAAYGSDAVAGVVNFILDTDYDGWKGSVQSGTSTYGDSDKIKADIAHGRSFANGLGHLLFSAEYYDNEAIGPYDQNRGWNVRGSGRINNRTGNGPSTLLVQDGATVAAATFGGLITSGPLAATQFGPGGEPMPFAYGDYRSSTFMVGGDGIRNDRNLSGGLERWSVFGRASYEFDTSFTGFAELTYSKADTQWEQYYSYCYTSCSATIYSDNAYLPEQTRLAMADAGIESFRLGRIHSENYILADNRKDVWRLAIGGEGTLDNGWNYDLYLTQGESDTFIGNLQTMHYRRYYAAIDAVDDGSGNIVCRSTLEGYDPGCVPFNPFGAGSPSAEALAYVTPDEWRNLVLEQTVIAGSVQGALGDIGGREIGFAAGIEWRDESSDQTASLLSQEIVDFTGLRGANPSIEGRQGPFIVGNPQPLAGSYDVGEVFAEVALPLIENAPLIDTLETDIAVRHTDYSLSGGATTWKVSMNYVPFEDLRVRATRSKDIRAANVAELFTGSRQGIGTARHPLTGETVDVVTKTRGNQNLDPEDADTLTLGVVVEPSSIEGLSLSLDYYDIEIGGAISTLGRQGTMDECFEENNQVACNNIELVGTQYRIDLPFLNLDLLEISGYDFEASYQTDFAAGDLSLRLLANYQDKFRRTTPNGSPDEQAGEVGRSDNPKLKGKISAVYNQDRFSLFAQQRYVDGGEYDNSLVEGVTINDNSVDSVWYTDVTATYRLGQDAQHELYLSVNNVFNEDPPFSPQVSGTHLSWSNYSLYDTIGRFYNLGFRYSF